MLDLFKVFKLKEAEPLPEQSVVFFTMGEGDKKTSGVAFYSPFTYRGTFHDPETFEKIHNVKLRNRYQLTRRLSGEYATYYTKIISPTREND